MQAILFHALELFCFCLTVQVVVWRLFPVRNQTPRLAMIFIVMPTFGAAVCLAISRFSPQALPGVEWTPWGLVYLLYFALSGFYLFLYTAVSGFSPSIAILQKVEASMPQGLKRNELAPKWFTDANLSGARRNNLLATGMVWESSHYLRLSPRGKAIASCLLIFRRFLGLEDIAKG